MKTNNKRNIVKMMAVILGVVFGYQENAFSQRSAPTSNQKRDEARNTPTSQRKARIIQWYQEQKRRAQHAYRQGSLTRQAYSEEIRRLRAIAKREISRAPPQKKRRLRVSEEKKEFGASPAPTSKQKRGEARNASASQREAQRQSIMRWYQEQKRRAQHAYRQGSLTRQAYSEEIRRLRAMARREISRGPQDTIRARGPLDVLRGRKRSKSLPLSLKDEKEPLQKKGSLGLIQRKQEIVKKEPPIIEDKKEEKMAKKEEPVKKRAAPVVQKDPTKVLKAHLQKFLFTAVGLEMGVRALVQAYPEKAGGLAELFEPLRLLRSNLQDWGINFDEVIKAHGLGEKLKTPENQKALDALKKVALPTPKLTGTEEDFKNWVNFLKNRLKKSFTHWKKIVNLMPGEEKLGVVHELFSMNFDEALGNIRFTELGFPLEGEAAGGGGDEGEGEDEEEEDDEEEQD